MYQFDNVNL